MAKPLSDVAPAAAGIDGVVRYVCLVGGMIGTMLLMSLAVGPLQSLRGVGGPTIAEATDPLVAVVWVSGTLVGSLLIASLVGRAINSAVGLFVLGSGIAVLSMQCGTVSDLIFAGGGFVPLVIETMVWAVVVLVLAAGMFRLSGPLPDISEGTARDAFDLRKIFTPLTARSALAGAVVIPIVWLLLFNELKGQAIAATTLGAIAAGMIGRSLSPHSQPILLFAAPVVFGALGYAIALTMVSGPIDEMFVVNALPRLARPMPLDYAAGALMGVAIGLGWSRGFIGEE